MVKNINILENRYEICTCQSNYPMGLLASFWDLRCTSGFDVMFTYTMISSVLQDLDATFFKFVLTVKISFVAC